MRLLRNTIAGIVMVWLFSSVSALGAETRKTVLFDEGHGEAESHF